MKVFLALVLALAGLVPVDASADTPFRVGVVVPLTAASGAIGECVKNSVILASEERDQEKRVEFLFEDDGLQASKTVPAVQKLINIDKVHALIVYGTPTSLAVNGIAESTRTPMIALSILDRVVAGKAYVVKHWVPSRTLNSKIVEEVKRRGYTRIAIVSALNDAMLALRDHFKTSNGSSVVMEGEMEIADVDVRPLVGRVKAASPDAVYVLLWPPQPGLFTKAMRRAGYSGAFFGAHNIADMHDVQVSEGAMEGAWFAVGEDNAGGYKAAYEARFKTHVTPGGADAYDAAALIIDGLKRGDVNGYLHTARNFSGASGTYDASGDNDFKIPAVLREVRGETFVGPK